MSTKKENISSKENKLEWGDHNPRLTEKNFVDGQPKKSNTTSYGSDADKAVDLSEEEPGRNRKGVREGESAERNK